MKKSVFIIIALIYIASVVFISFFGLKMVSYNPQVYATSVQYTNNDIIIDSSQRLKVILHYKANLQYQLQWKVLPENTTNQNVEFIYSQQNAPATVSSSGLVIFNVLTETTLMDITISTLDGSSRTQTINIIVIV